MLELYAAGALTPPEQEEVERMAALHPEVKAELDSIRLTLEGYVQLHAVAPRPELKQRVLTSILGESDAEEDTRTVSFAPPATGLAEADDARVVPFGEPTGQPRRSAFSWALAASVALILLSNIISFYFYQNWKDTESRLASALAREQQFVQNYKTVENQLALRERDLSVLRDPQYQAVAMKGLDIAPSSSATVYWNPQNNQVYLSVANLPAPPPGFQYQLWALEDGKPIDAGLVPTEGQLQSLQPMKAIRRAQAFAVTLEPEGGSVNPTLEKMYLMGNV